MPDMTWDAQALSDEISQAASELMASLRMRPLPHNYALCYHHIKGDNRDLSHEFDAAIRSGQIDDPDVTWEIHARHFGQGADLSQMTAAIELQLQQLISALSSATAGTSAYEQTLTLAAAQLRKSPTPTRLADLVGSVAEATQRMIDANRQLDQDVKSSSREMSTLRQKMEAFRHESLVDALTGIANRRSFDLSLETVTAAAKAGPTPLSVLMCDIDHFKRFNDTWGHQTGDQVLRLVAHCISSCVTAGDVVARYGGEEVSILLPGSTLSEAVEVAERIRSLVEQRQIIKKSSGEKMGSVTLSIGCAEFDGNEAIADTIARADESLYDAKRSGRNRVCARGLLQTQRA